MCHLHSNFILKKTHRRVTSNVCLSKALVQSLFMIKIHETVNFAAFGLMTQFNMSKILQTPFNLIN